MDIREEFDNLDKELNGEELTEEISKHVDIDEELVEKIAEYQALRERLTQRRKMEISTTMSNVSTCGFGDKNWSSASYIKTSIAATILIIVALQFWHDGESKVVAATKPATSVWKEWTRGTIIDVDPYMGGMLFEFQKDDKTYSWATFSHNSKVGDMPARGLYGAFYTRKTEDGEKVKWVTEKPRVQKIQPETKKAVLNPLKPNSFWKSIFAGLPSIDKTVLVKYKNGVTITTAYINKKKEWKLETDRDRVSGGREVKTINEWQEIPN